MYKQATLDGDALAGTAGLERPLGPGFKRALIEKADAMDVWCSGLMDPGQDWTRYDLKCRGKVIATVVVPGY